MINSTKCEDNSRTDGNICTMSNQENNISTGTGKDSIINSRPCEKWQLQLPQHPKGQTGTATSAARLVGTVKPTTGQIRTAIYTVSTSSNRILDIIKRTAGNYTINSFVSIQYWEATKKKKQQSRQLR